MADQTFAEVTHQRPVTQGDRAAVNIAATSDRETLAMARGLEQSFDSLEREAREVARNTAAMMEHIDGLPPPDQQRVFAAFWGLRTAENLTRDISFDSELRNIRGWAERYPNGEFSEAEEIISSMQEAFHPDSPDVEALEEEISAAKDYLSREDLDSSARLITESALEKAEKGLSRLALLSDATQTYNSTMAELGLTAELDPRAVMKPHQELTMSVANWTRDFAHASERGAFPGQAELARRSVELFLETESALFSANSKNAFGRIGYTPDYVTLIGTAADLLVSDPAQGMELIEEHDLVAFGLERQAYLTGDFEAMYQTDFSPVSFSEAYLAASPEVQQEAREPIVERWGRRFPELRSLSPEEFVRHEAVQAETADKRYYSEEVVARANASYPSLDRLFYKAGNQALTAVITAAASLEPGSRERTQMVRMLQEGNAVEVLFRRLATHTTDNGTTMSGNAFETPGSSSFVGPRTAIMALASMEEMQADFSEPLIPAITEADKREYDSISIQDWLARQFPEEGVGDFWQRDGVNKGAHRGALEDLHRQLSPHHQ